MLFSVIIPTFNSESTIRECMESLKEQDSTDFQVLVMDGGSTDRTTDVASEYLSYFGNRLILRSEPDAGVYDAMNKGIRQSMGEWLLFLGSDDRMHDGTVLSSISKMPQIEYSDFIYGNALLLHAGDVYDGKFDLPKILFERNICHQAIFYRRSIFEKYGFYDLRYPVYADYDLNIRCFQNGRIRRHFINRLICIYNERDGLTGKNTPDLAFHYKRDEYREKFLGTLKGRLYSQKIKNMRTIQRIKNWIKGKR